VLKSHGLNITNEDNMELMARYKDNHFDLAIVDPPYRNSKDNDMNQWNRKTIKSGRLKDWNNKPNKEFFDELFRVSKNQIIWGANNFKLPEHKGFVIWRKKSISEGFNMSMCEYAYLSEGLGTISKCFEHIPQIKDRIHPTQKPVQLYEWLLKMYAKQGQKVLDTHLGSGSIAIACNNKGIDLTACELDKKYYNDAMQRIKKYKLQQKMF
tara:strand:+ start:80 stop:709 length:630 start_codon:yes stop_codon:yes gene_type:complete